MSIMTYNIYNFMYYHHSLNSRYYHYTYFTEKEIEAQRLMFGSYIISIHLDFQ